MDFSRHTNYTQYFKYSQEVKYDTIKMVMKYDKLCAVL